MEEKAFPLQSANKYDCAGYPKKQEMSIKGCE